MKPDGSASSFFFKKAQIMLILFKYAPTPAKMRKTGQVGLVMFFSTYYGSAKR
jgi:hypothetical protein